MNDKVQEFGWWIKIVTDKPRYIYYFGAFDNYWEAEWCKNGYIQDLEEEETKIIDIKIEKCKPKQLTYPFMRYSA